MTDVAARSHHGVGPQRSWSRRALVALAVLVVAALGFASPSEGSPPIRTATSGCVAVGGGAVSSGGPQRATVVVDTGSGTVWSACISFSGSISGIKALELANGIIPGLNPVYDTYAGQGKAVCGLLGVGTDPPDCLGKDVNYWNYFANGAYARGGAGNTTVNDGDVQGWRFGTGTAPRPAAAGTAATSAPPPTTAPPAPPVTAPPGSSGGGISGSSGGGQSPAPEGSTPGAEPGDPAASSGDQPNGSEPEPDNPTEPEATSTTKTSEAAEVESAAAERRDGSDEAADGDESAAGVAVTEGGSPATSTSGSSWPALLGFAAVLAAIAAGVVMVRRRRTVAA